MADFSTVARPYAKALFDLANGERKLPEWSAALGAAAAVLADAEREARARESGVRRRGARHARRLDRRRDQGRRAADERRQARICCSCLSENDRLTALPEIAAQFDALKAKPRTR